MAYEEFFGLKDTPFRLTPDPEYYFPSDVHKEALQTLLYSIRAGEGFVQITGEPGTGKTLILRTIMRQLGSKVTTALILNPSLSPSELLRVILEDLGLDPLQTEEKPKEALLRYFRDTLLEKARHGIKTVIIIDEAQNLPNETMEELRLLSNLETEKEKLLQIILVGQVELEKKLRNPELKQLNQRITIRYRLKPLSKQDAIAYIYHRINVAGGGEHIRFSPRVLERIYTLSDGVPRMINIICERALMAAFVESKNTVAMTQVKKAMESIAGEEELRPRRSPQWVGYAAAVVFIAVALGAAVGWYLYGPIGMGKSLLTADSSGSPAVMTRDGDGVVQQLKTVISEKEAEAEKRDAELRNKVNELEQKVSTLSQKETLLKEKEYLLREKEADLSQKEVVLVGKEDSLSEKEEQLRQAEQSIGEKKEGLTHKETILSEKEETLVKKEELLAKKAAAVEAAGSVFPPVDSMAVAASCSIPKGSYVVLLDIHTKNASIWQGTDSQPLLKGEFAYEWPLGEGLFIVGKDAVRGEFVFHHMSFFWGNSSARDAKLWGKIAPFVDGINVALMVYSPRTIAAMSKGDNPASGQAKAIKKTITAWADAWIKKQIDTLITFYGALFTNYYLQMDKPLVFTREQFYLLKKDVLDKSGAISLTISDPLCIVNPENPRTAIAVFKQSYRSAIYSDDGTKVLYFAAIDDPAGTQTWKIAAKLWLPSEANE